MDKTVQKSNNVCRLCLSEDEKHLNPASALINASCSIQDIERFTGIQIQQHECGVYAICVDCGEKLKNAVAFRRLCIQNDTLFRQLFDCLTLFAENTPKDGQCFVMNEPEEACHKIYQQGNREYELQCNICLKQFTSANSYNLHCVRYHATADERNRPKAKKKQLCGICGMMVSQLATHSLTHSQEKHFACPHCPIKMTDKANLSRHIQAVHLKKVLRTCETCGKEFLHVNLYKYHMLSVHGIGKTFDCDICLKKFKTLAVLKIHKVSVHSNEKRFECGTCGMMFKAKHTLRTHENRVHSVEKHFACSQCPKRFKSPSGKKSHELTHSGIIFSCTFCEKTYRYKSLLQTHMKKQHAKIEETNMKS